MEGESLYPFTGAVCEVRTQFAKGLPFKECHICGVKPSYHHGRCRPAKWNAEEQKKATPPARKCRFVHHGNAVNDQATHPVPQCRFPHIGSAETIEAKKKEYDELKAHGVLGEDESSESEKANPVPREFVDRLTLRYAGCKSAAQLAGIIDKRRKGNKIHVWPGCKKIHNRADADVLSIHRHNGFDEDRAKILFDNNMWCAECNPQNEVLPSAMGRQCSALWQAVIERRANGLIREVDQF